MGFAHPEYLVTTGWLAEHLDDPAVVVVDVTAKLTRQLRNEAGQELWSERHIPGSRFFDVASAHGTLSDPDASLPWTWPSAERFAEVAASYGIGADTRVVIVGRTPRPGIDSGTMWCTRTWWTMHHFGVDCGILLGGIERWDAEGRTMVARSAPRAAPPARPLEIDRRWTHGRASKEDVLAAVERGDAASCLIDALSVDSFEGRESTYGRPGHIPTATNVPFTALIERETCAFVDPDTMTARLGDALAAPNVITYCGGAIAATVPAFCLALLGHEHVSVYDGSLMEWAADPDVPMVVDESG